MRESFGGIQAGEWHYLVPILNTLSGCREWVLRGEGSGGELMPARNRFTFEHVVDFQYHSRLLIFLVGCSFSDSLKYYSS